MRASLSVGGNLKSVPYMAQEGSYPSSSTSGGVYPFSS